MAFPSTLPLTLYCIPSTLPLTLYCLPTCLPSTLPLTLQLGLHQERVDGDDGAGPPLLAVVTTLDALVELEARRVNSDDASGGASA